jgi:hypothetical protein
MTWDLQRVVGLENIINYNDTHENILQIPHYNEDGSVNQDFLNLFPPEHFRFIIYFVLTINKRLELLNLPILEIPDNFISDCFRLSQVNFEEFFPNPERGEIYSGRFRSIQDNDYIFQESHSFVTNNDEIEDKRSRIGYFRNGAANGFCILANEIRIQFGTFESGHLINGAIWLIEDTKLAIGCFKDDGSPQDNEHLWEIQIIKYNQESLAIATKYIVYQNIGTELETRFQINNKESASTIGNEFTTNDGQRYNRDEDDELIYNTINDIRTNKIFYIPAVILNKEPFYDPNNTNSILHYNVTVKHFDSSIKIEKIPVEAIIGNGPERY